MDETMTRAHFLSLLHKHQARTGTEWVLRGKLKMLRCGEDHQHCPITFVCQFEAPPLGPGTYRSGEYPFAGMALCLSQEDSEALAIAADARPTMNRSLRAQMIAICEPKEVA